MDEQSVIGWSDAAWLNPPPHAAQRRVLEQSEEAIAREGVGREHQRA